MTTINGGKILLRLDDGNTIELYTKKTKQAKKATDDLNRTEQTLNRNFKGASRQSSNTTKNFSKMAQGITGGLVPAYATLAANIFAIGAAFRFLQSAADLRILEQGQLEYAQRTGQSLAILTRQLQAATGQQLAFADAAQAVAIGTAAGLSAKQINNLGTVAKNASLMLGRDLTDSFNRLIRGAVKAEPELLDELGIILRLETATEKYALSINKAKNQLNIFEKSQAVVNEVLEQGNEKFGAVETQVNQLTKLAKAFDDLVNTLKRGLGPAAEFIAKALSQNTLAVAGAGTLLGTNLARAVTPQPAPIDVDAAGNAARSKLAGIYSGKRDLNNLTRKDLDALERDIKNAYARKRSTVINFEKMRRTEALQTVNILRMTTLEEERMRSRGFLRFRYDIELTYRQYRLEHGKTMAFIKTSAVTVGKAFRGLLALTGYAGLLISLIGLFKQFFDQSSKADQKFKEAQKEFGTLFSRNAKDLQKTVGSMKEYNSLMTTAIQNAKALGNIDFSAALPGLKGGMGGRKLTKYDLKGNEIEMNKFTEMYTGFLYDLGITAGVTATKAISADQIAGIQGIIDILEEEQKLLIAGSDAHNQHNFGIEVLTELLNDPTNQKAFDNALDFIKGIGKDGTIAANSMQGIAMSTQMLTSSVSDFSKALNSFRTAQTPLTRLTTNIKQVGEVLSGIGEGFGEGNVALDFNPVTGTLFDKAMQDALATMLPAGSLDKLEFETEALRNLAIEREKYLHDPDKVYDTGKTKRYMVSMFDRELLDKGHTVGEVIDIPVTVTGAEMAEEKVRQIQEVGAHLFMRYGRMVEAEAKRMHDMEMTMIADKTKVQRNLTLASMGATKLQISQLQKQGKLAQNQLDIENQETLLAELKKKGLTLDDAQVKAEQQKLYLMQAQGLELQNQLNDNYLLAQAAKNAFESGISGGLNDLITGKESSFKDAMAKVAKGVFESVSKQLSDQMARGISNFLFGNRELDTYYKGAEIIRQAHIDGIQSGMGARPGAISDDTSTSGFFGKVMGFFGGFGSFLGFAKGGITPVYAASGGRFEGPKSGYPAMLHGNEAVVPLPDGKSIPVSGGMGGTVNVSVNMTTGETSTTSNDAEQMNAIGQSIAQAVQNELERQQRPGGMLAPY